MPEATFVTPSCSRLLYIVLSSSVHQSQYEILKYSAQSHCHCLILVMEILQVVISVEQRREEKQKGCAQRCCVND